MHSLSLSLSSLPLWPQDDSSWAKRRVAADCLRALEWESAWNPSWLFFLIIFSFTSLMSLVQIFLCGCVYMYGCVHKRGGCMFRYLIMHCRQRSTSSFIGICICRGIYCMHHSMYTNVFAFILLFLHIHEVLKYKSGHSVHFVIWHHAMSKARQVSIKGQ